MKCSDNTPICSKGFFAGLGSAIFLQLILLGIHFSDWPEGKKKKVEKHSYMVKYLFALGGNAFILVLPLQLFSTQYEQEVEATGR